MSARERFSAGFERCFAHIYAYVSLGVSDRKSCERVVSEVLAAHLDLLVGHGYDGRALGRLEASADRLIGLLPATARHASTTSTSHRVEGTGDTQCQESRAEF